MEHVRQSYLSTQVSTIGQGDVVVLLFEKAIFCLNQAKEKIAERDYATKGLLISRAIDIINLLDTSLNMEKGGDLAENLHNLYFYCNTQLLQANLKLDCDKIDAVIHTLAELNEAFTEVVKDPEAQAVAEEIGRKFEKGGEQRIMTAAPSAGAGSKAAKNAYTQAARSAGLEVANSQESTQEKTQEKAPEKIQSQSISTLSMATALMGSGLNAFENSAKPAPTKPMLQKPLTQEAEASKAVNPPPLNNTLLSSSAYVSNMIKAEAKTAQNEEKPLHNTPNKLVNPLAKSYMNSGI